MNETVATVSVAASASGTADVKGLFESMATEWKEKSRCTSGDVQSALLKCFQRIIGIGRPAVPLILEELRREPSAAWIWALEAITGENLLPAEAAFDASLQTKAWLEWGETHAGEPPHDVPFDELRQRFSALSAEWKKKSHYMSNTAQMARLPSYQRIIGMGWPAVPLILEELRQRPIQWYWALQAITGENPVAPEIAGKVGLAAKAWVDWGIAHGLIRP